MRPPLSSRPSFLPDEIARREFATVFRGYDPAEVRTFLNQLAEQSTENADRIAEVQRQLAESQDQVKNPELDEETVTKLLGTQTAQILRSAREAANEIRAKAEEEVSKSLREAHEVTSKMKEEAEALLKERTDEAEKAAADIKKRSEEESARIKSETEAEMLALRQQTQSDLVDERAKARQQMRDLIDTARAEAQALVERTNDRQNELIEGLVRKRKIALAQVEELRAGRARLLDAYKMVRETLDDVTNELGRAENEARDEATAAGHRSAEQSGIDVASIDEVVELQQFDLDDDVSQQVIDLSIGDGEQPFGEASETVDLAGDDADDDDDAIELREMNAQQQGGNDEADLARRAAIVDKAVSQVSRRVKRAMQDEQEALTARFANRSDESIDAIIGSMDDQTATYQRSIVKLMREVVRSGADNVVDQAILDRTGTSASRDMAAELVEELRNQLIPTLEALMAADDVDADTASSDIANAYRTMKDDYVDNLVSERVTGAYDQGAAFATTV